MNKKVKIGSGGVVTLTDKNYKTAGGEAEIYVNGGMVYKLYHEPTKKQLPIKKMNELSQIKNQFVITPKEIIYDSSTGEPLGYTAPYIDNVDPLLKYFTRTFKQDNKISTQQIEYLVKQLQKGTIDIHSVKCLIVDFNELNVLVNMTSMNPYFIDTDSYTTPSFRATAIMDSVRDRRVSTQVNGKLVYNPDEFSDWFSWGILSFWLYTNIHPFRGGHSSYKPKDKQKQMDDGISVFHKNVRVPPSVNNFNVIPPRHLEWFKDTFLDNNRSVPPFADSTSPVVLPNQIITIKGTNKVDVTEVSNYSDRVVSVYRFLGMNYVVTNKKVFCGQKELMDRSSIKKIFLSLSNDGTMIAATMNSGMTVEFSELVKGTSIGTISAKDIFARNGAIYTVANGKLTENTFSSMGSTIMHRAIELENISNLSSKMYDGCIIQDLLGKKFITIPYKKGMCTSKYLDFLDHSRIVDAKSERNVTVIITEHKGEYDRFILIFNKDFSDYHIRKHEDIGLDVINMTVLENGLCALLTSPDEMELFVSNSKVEILDNPPFDSTMKLFSNEDGIFFINDNSIHKIKKK